MCRVRGPAPRASAFDPVVAVDDLHNHERQQREQIPVALERIDYCRAHRVLALHHVTHPCPTVATTSAPVTRTDYTLGANGTVTLAAAPPSGAVLAWTGSYWKRVRFTEDSLSSDRIVQQMWKAATVELETV